MRRLPASVACAVLLLLPLAAVADGLDPQHFEVGQRGELKGPSTGDYWELTALAVIDDSTLLLKLGAYPPFILHGYPACWIAAGKKVTISGRWKVAGRKKHGEETLYLLQPACWSRWKAPDTKK